MTSTLTLILFAISWFGLGAIGMGIFMMLNKSVMTASESEQFVNKVRWWDCAILIALGYVTFGIGICTAGDVLYTNYMIEDEED